MERIYVSERDDPDWPDPVVDLIYQGRCVAMAYARDNGLFVEFIADAEPDAFDLAQLQHALDVAAAILGGGYVPVEAPDAGPSPVEALAADFDARAVHRGPEDEGFYPADAAAQMVRRCGEVGLAVVSLEGFTVRRHYEDQGPGSAAGSTIDPVAGCASDIGDAYRGEPWAVFQAGCNTKAAALLERWPRRPNFAVALEVEDSSGERYVL
jgi:hypothetical protein